MEEYVINPDPNNLDNPLFKWYLVFATMSQTFSAILDIVLPYGPIKMTNGVIETTKPLDRAYHLIYRIALGYSSEAQQTIRQFIKSEDYTYMLSILDEQHRQSFEANRLKWEESNTEEEWKYLSELRNKVFHFASRPEDFASVVERFRKAVKEINANSDIQLKIRENNMNGRETRDDCFTDKIWEINIDTGYNKIKSPVPNDHDDYARAVSLLIVRFLESCYDFIYPTRDFLEQYFIHLGLIKPH